MKAIILAAGRGSRMGSLTADQPKCLTVVHGKSLIEHQINALSEAGIKEIAIVTGYKSEMLRSYGTYHFHNPRWEETNMVSSLLCAKEWLDESDCIVSYSDIFYGSQIIKDLIACKDDIAIAYDPNWLELWSKRFKNPLDDAETFRIDDNGFVTEIGQKASSVEEIQGQYMGLLRFKKGIFLNCTKKNSDEVLEKIDMTNFLCKLIQSAFKIIGIVNIELWGECDNQQDVFIVDQYMVSQ
ncbi:MAG: phosphocholine cytidylyltransferase family protein [Alphaproteobacteria bacterium]